MRYPTIEEVEVATSAQLKEWIAGLAPPGENAMGLGSRLQPVVKRKEEFILNEIIRRFEQKKLSKYHSDTDAEKTSQSTVLNMPRKKNGRSVQAKSVSTRNTRKKS